METEQRSQRHSVAPQVWRAKAEQTGLEDHGRAGATKDNGGARGKGEPGGGLRHSWKPVLRPGRHLTKVKQEEQGNLVKPEG